MDNTPDKGHRIRNKTGRETGAENRYKRSGIVRLPARPASEYNLGCGAYSA